MKRMQLKTKVCITATVAAICSLAFLSMAAAAGSITLTPTSQAPAGSVTVAGTGFGATKAVAIGFGAEMSASQSDMAYSGTGAGPYGGTLAYHPIKPGSFVLTSDTTSGGGVVTDYTDNGDGTLSSTSPYFVAGTINCVTGQWSRTSSVDLTGIDQLYSATYIRYDVTVANTTTTASGTFSVSITVPSVANGNYNVTAIDTQGNRAVSSLAVSGVIPEGFPTVLIMLLTAAAVIASSWYFRRRLTIKTNAT
jgi:hypothetical protein